MDRQEGTRGTFGPNVGGLHYASKFRVQISAF